MYVKAERNTIMKNNEEIILKAKSGDQEAITQIYNENVNKVYFLCLKFLKNSDDANDITQDTFVKVFTSLDQLKNPSALSSWILTIAANLCKNHLKKSNRFIASDEDDETIFNIEETDDAFIPEQSADNAETRRLVMEIIDRLPDGQRMAIILFYYNEMSIKEIAEVLECTENAVKLRLNHARQTIKEEVLKLEEKGTKLYGVPIIPLLGSIFHYEAINTVPPTIAASNASLLSQSTQVSTNARTAAASAKAAAAGGKVMTKMTKIIIAALAAVVVAGGAITAVVIANNNNNSTQTQGLVKNNSSDEDESSKKDDESSASEPTSEEPSSKEPLSEEAPASSEPSSENSEEELKAEEQALAQEIHAQVISCGLYDPKELGSDSDSENKKYTRLVFMFTTPNKSGQAYDSLGTSKMLKLYDKNGEKIDTYPTYYKMNDNSCVYIVPIHDEYSVDDLNIKLYSSKTKNAYDIKEFNRSEANINYATGQISAGDYVKINGNPYIYAGIALTTSGYSGSDSKNEDRDYIQMYHEFVSISSNHERILTDGVFKVDYSGTTSLPKSEYPLEAKLSVNDDKSVRKVAYRKTIEVCMLEIAMILPHNDDVDNLDDIWKRDANPYTEALMVVYEDKDSDYSFKFNYNGNKPSGY